MTLSFAEWLRLREPADHEVRSLPLLGALLRHLPGARPLRVVDLGSGTGSNLRYLAPRLPSPQEWLLVDRDAALLSQALVRSPVDAVTTRAVPLDDLDDAAIIAGHDLVTGAALLDLVSPAWLDTLAARCRTAGAAVLFALSYDGRTTCTPADPEDGEMLELFNGHQRGNDHGFGTAAGPDATTCAARSFEEAGYTVRRARADWHLAPEHTALQRPLIVGWAQAISEMVPNRRDWVEAWMRRRLAYVDAGESTIMVGHEDLCGWLTPSE